MDPDIDPVEEAVRILRNEGPARFLVRAANFLRKEAIVAGYAVSDVVSGRRVIDVPEAVYSGHYVVEHQTPGVDSFDFLFRFDSPHRRERIDGIYERAVADELVARCDDETVLYEVGAGWGYHTLSVAPIIDQAVGFDPDSERTRRFRGSVSESGFENVDVVESRVDCLDDHLSEFGTPDVVLVDIDGGEYDVLPASERLLESGCVWIVELHHDAPAVSEGEQPAAIEEMFRKNGYRVERIREHYQRDHFDRRTKELNTHHIVAEPTSGRGS